jgi:hypothetical protein
MPDSPDGLTAKQACLAFCVDAINIPRKFAQEHPWVKIAAIIITLMVTIVLIGAAITGGLALAGNHVAFLAPLNTAITSVWKGMPYLLVACGGPGLLFALALMAYGVYELAQALRNCNKNNEEKILDADKEEKVPKADQNAIGFRLEGKSYIIKGNDTIEVTEKNGDKTTIKLNQYKREAVKDKGDVEDFYFSAEMAQRLSDLHAVFIFIQDTKDRIWGPEFYLCIVSEGKDRAYDLPGADLEMNLEQNKDRLIITDIGQFHNLIDKPVG